MGSFGQGSFGQTPFGSSQPNHIYALNIAAINALDPVFELAAEHMDSGEHVFFETKIFRGMDDLGHWQQQRDYPANFDPSRCDIMSLGGVAMFTPGIALDPSEYYTMMVRSTTDALGDLEPSRDYWWTDWIRFRFKPGINIWNGEISDFILWETSFMDTAVPVNGSCHNSAPYAIWKCPDVYDYYVWGIATNQADSSMPFKTKNGFIDFNTYPIFDGVWYFRLAPVYGGVIGKIHQHRFEVKNTILTVN
ncbi:MAG: hypothetical protein A2Y38_04125 [Spirochaetes bacterium GWB1_59_5]|nr:MAG: hypothetical protein A2Y38_04125 [Spirochaetes bacterium GWB1_59_5]